MRLQQSCMLMVLLCGAVALHGEEKPAAKPDKPKLAHAPRVHAVSLGAVRREPYSQASDPAGARPGETELPVRPLVVDTRVKDWTTGESHDVTDRSFAVRRALRINDALPADKGDHWAWQRGPWLLVDRATGHAVPIKLPDFEPAVSDVVWFRDFAAYCGLTKSGRQLYGVVAQVSARRPLLARKLGAWDPATAHTGEACAPATWQRDPMRVTFTPAGLQASSFDVLASSAVLAESDDEDDAANASAAPSTRP